MNITKFNVEVMDLNGNVIDSSIIEQDLSIGGSANLEIPFTLPEQIARTDYTLRITPYNEEDILLTDNETTFGIGFADLTIKDLVEVKTDNGRQLQITIKNQGYEMITSAYLKIFSGSAIGDLLVTKDIAELDVGEEIVLTYDIATSSLNDSSLEPNLYYLLVETEENEENYSNNTTEIFIYPDCSINLTAGSGGTVQGTGSYTYNTSVTVEAFPNEGYIFEGWYEDGKHLDNLSQEYVFNVFTDRSLEAKFISNDLAITDVEVFGTLVPENTITFTAEAEGGCQPYEWDFYIYKGDTLYYSNTESVFNFFEWSSMEAGTYTVVAYVTDATGYRVTFSKHFSIE